MNRENRTPRRPAPKDVNRLRSMSDQAVSEYCDRIRESRAVPMLLYFVVLGKLDLGTASYIPIERSRALDDAFDMMVRESTRDSWAALMDNDVARSQLRERKVRARLRAA